MKKTRWEEIPRSIRSLILLILLCTVTLCILLLLLDRSEDTSFIKYAKENTVFFISGAVAAFIILFIFLLNAYKKIFSIIGMFLLGATSAIVINNILSFGDASIEMSSTEQELQKIQKELPFEYYSLTDSFYIMTNDSTRLRVMKELMDTMVVPDSGYFKDSVR
ncbi:MAG: hypothetical protein JW995_13145 [Melioribacteraceae bacterium]|nr:hypothetical protein [Melioribacteraceae bacterium]